MTLPLLSATGVATPRSFDIRDRLPAGGITVLEASAGTGKTFTVGALVSRYVAEGVATLDQLLVVTFGRAASQELRERVREQLLDAQRALADPAAARSSDNEVIAMLAEGDADTVAARRHRLTGALADFDAATIATTHQFCQQVLIGLGIAGDSEPGTTLVDDLDDVVVEVVDDLYVRRFGAAGAEPPAFDRTVALELGRRAVDDPDARLEPAAEPVDSVAALRVRFAQAVRAEFDRRKRQRGLLGFDDLLSRLADALRPAGAAARQRMRSRWRIVLIDEFQDTDPVQWDVLRLAFADPAPAAGTTAGPAPAATAPAGPARAAATPTGPGGARRPVSGEGAPTLILIGDPKQAIYAFRGGDVHTYLAAAATAELKETLGQNWRSDAPLVDALQVLFDGAELGDPDIVVRPVRAANAGSRLAGAPSDAPLRLRVATREQFGKGPRSKVYMDQVRPHIAADLAADVALLLRSGATFGGRPLLAGDVAVLVNTHAQAFLIREALASRDIPSVTSGAGSVYATRAGDDWMTLLEALEQPSRSGRVRAAALTPFLGRSAAELDRGGEALTDQLGALLQEWANLLRSRGVAALLELSFAEQGLPGRLLAERDGERRLTDLRHLGEGLQAAAAEEGLGLAALAQWLRRRRAESALDQSTGRIRRLDSDAAAVQVLTLHVSKGLQFPVVYLPFAADVWVNSEPRVLRLHDEGGSRVLDVGGFASTGRPDRERQAAAEQAGETLRLLYVGLTRAQSQVVTWWVPSSNTPDSGLHRLLFGRTPGSSAVPDSAPLPGDDEVRARLSALAAAGGPAVEPAVAGAVPPLAMRPAAAQAFSIGAFDRPLDTAWRRASYSALSAAAEQAAAGVASEPETGERDDETLPGGPHAAPFPSTPTSPGTAAESRAAEKMRSVLSPMIDLPAGTGFGTLVHAVLEHVDPQAPDLLPELESHCVEQLARHGGAVGSAALAQALLPVLSTPLGPVAGGRSLRDVAVSDRLTELTFELPLAGGDQPAVTVTLGEVAPLLRRHLAADDPIARYADRLASPEMAWQALRGYLTGSIDVVLRLPGPRYVIADYKTNWLGGDTGEPLSAWHYRPDALQQAMTHSDYPLQALLYSVALHRFLRWREPAYRPDEHLGGVLYLYVRGMTGADVPTVAGQPCGVFGWRPPAALVTDLSDLLDQGPDDDRRRAAHPRDPFDVQIALRATGLLRVFNDAEVLTAADVHVAGRLGRLAGEADEQVLLALALAVRGLRGGSVCVDLARVSRADPSLDWPEYAQWVDKVRASPLVGPGRPLRWDLDLLYLDRYWRQEEQVRADLVARENQLPPSVDADRLAAALDRLFEPGSDQRLAAEVAAGRWTTVLGGGPGTGKTTTVAALLAVLHEQHEPAGPRLRVALAAPTGKAAARLEEAIHQATARFGPTDRAMVGVPTASTLHRLLGSRPGERTRFAHDRDNRLPHDVVVVDESSMLSLTMMARLLEAVRPDARLVLVGDPDQLASVEAGAVLADLVAGLTTRELSPPSAEPISGPSAGATPAGGSAAGRSPAGWSPVGAHSAGPPAAGRQGVVVLRHTWRFSGAIAALAAAVREGDADTALEVLGRGDAALALEESGPGLRADVVAAATAIRLAALRGHARSALGQLDHHRLLCAHRSGPFGVDAWSRTIERWLAEVPGDPREGEWYVGRPLLITVNDYALGLFNGDTGVIVRQSDGIVRAVFRRGDELVDFAPSRLSDVQTVHAMTVHRSQGSQFERVTVVLPPPDSPLSTREMLYTALTRAQQHVRLIGTAADLRAAVDRPAARASGLRLRLAGLASR